MPGFGASEQETTKGAGLLTVTGQLTVCVSEPEVTVRLGLYVPGIEKDSGQVESVPVQSPDHWYVYEPSPPETMEAKVIVWPVVAGLGEAEQETTKGSAACTWAGKSNGVIKILKI